MLDLTNDFERTMLINRKRISFTPFSRVHSISLMMQLSHEANLICELAVHIHWLKDSSSKLILFSILSLLPRPQRNQTNQVLISKIQSNWTMTGEAFKFQRDSTNHAISCTKILRNFYLPYMSLSLKYKINIINSFLGILNYKHY